MSVEVLYQDENCLPEPLQPHHFREGLLYTMTKHANRRNSMLILIIEAKGDTFAYNCYFQQTSSANTLHQTGNVIECSYDDIWRLAPRRKLIQPHQPENSSPGQMLRFVFGMDSDTTTVTVLRRLLKRIQGQVVCGRKRGLIKM